ARYPVTNRQFQAFVDAPDGYGDQKWWNRIERTVTPSSTTWSEANHPREMVSWYEAVAFCRWLTEKSRACGLLGKSQEIRLPTEWEWQQAATNGNNYNVYPWGKSWDSTLCNSYTSALNRTSAVGIFPNGTGPGGPLDMAGKVWEGCLKKKESLKERDATKIDKTGQPGTAGVHGATLRGHCVHLPGTGLTQASAATWLAFVLPRTSLDPVLFCSFTLLMVQGSMFLNHNTARMSGFRLYRTRKSE